MLTRTLFHLWGPFFVYTFGTVIALGCIICYYLILNNPKRASIINEPDLMSLFSISILVGIIGGRTLYLLSSYHELNSFLDVITFHEGGFSILGTTIALLLFIPCYLKIKQIPIAPLLDLISIYTPLLQSISRLGCFFAGCCYGKSSTAFWAIQYTNPDTLAPLNCWLHPTQLYSAITLFLTFLILYTWGQSHIKKAGQLFCLSMLLSSLSRFLVDFLRDDQEFFSSTSNLLSIHQWIALVLMIGAAIGYVILDNKQRLNS